MKAGNTYTIAQALVYNDGTRAATATFLFRVTLTNGEVGAQLVEKTNGIHDIMRDGDNGNSQSSIFNLQSLYDLSGRHTYKANQGIYIQNGKKYIAK